MNEKFIGPNGVLYANQGKMGALALEALGLSIRHYWLNKDGRLSKT